MLGENLANGLHKVAFCPTNKIYSDIWIICLNVDANCGFYNTPSPTFYASISASLKEPTTRPIHGGCNLNLGCMALTYQVWSFVGGMKQAVLNSHLHRWSTDTRRMCGCIGESLTHKHWLQDAASHVLRLKRKVAANLKPEAGSNRSKTLFDC